MLMCTSLHVPPLTSCGLFVGYVGCAWAVIGTHDIGFAERAVFGKIRYMNDSGCKRKFKVANFVSEWARHGATVGSAGFNRNKQQARERDRELDAAAGGGGGAAAAAAGAGGQKKGAAAADSASSASASAAAAGPRAAAGQKNGGARGKKRVAKIERSAAGAAAEGDEEPEEDDEQEEAD